MKVSSTLLTWAMRLYPPLLFQRIWVQNILPDFMSAHVKINRSLFTLNFGKAIFGGTLYSATDPFYAMLFGQILLRREINPSIWVKSSKIQFIKPGTSNLYYSIKITEEEVEDILSNLNKSGIVVKSFTIHLKDKKGVLHTIATNELYIRKK